MATEPQITTVLKRNRDGLRVTVKLNPKVEEFFRTMVEGAGTQDAATFGRYWRSDKPLPLYHLADKLAGIQYPKKASDNFIGYRLDQPGNKLQVGDGYINLSFLRLAGASEGDGVSFTVVGVYGEDGVLDLNSGIEQAIEHFYRNYLKPVTVTTIISSLKEGGSGGYEEVRESR